MPHFWHKAINAPFLITLFILTPSFFFRLYSNELHDYIKSIVDECVTYRKKNNVFSNDFLGSLLQSQEKNGFDDETLYAHVSALLLDGIETSSFPIQMALYELTLNPRIQEHLKDEIDKVYEKYDGKITYEILQEMRYLDRVYKGTASKL